MNRFFGDKAFYKKVLVVALPIMLQNGISNFVNFLDNIMVGRMGTEQMSGVSIVNQLTFVYFLCLFGAIGGAGIMGAQFFGKGDFEGVRQTFRFKVYIGTLILLAAVFIFLKFDTQLISLYLHEGSADGDLQATLQYGKVYMGLIIIGLIPGMLENCYSFTLRESGETVVPMVASVTAVFVNLIFNYILIFGKFGAPAMGVAGAAIATNISRFIQVGIVMIWAHTHTDKVPYMKGVWKSFKVPVSLCKRILILAFPLVLNETLWAGGIAAQTQIYSVRGLAVVAALNINTTIFNVFNVAFIALGDAVAIIVGQLLGAGKLEEGKETAYRIITFSTMVCLGIGTMMFFTAAVFPNIYNTTQEVRSMAANMLRVSAVTMPIGGFLHSTYFTIRSGGKTGITFLFDSVFLWVISVPAGLFLTFKTGMDIVLILLIVNLLDLLKAGMGIGILRSGVWLQNIVGNKEEVNELQ